MIETAGQTDRAILIGVILPLQSEDEVADYLDELAFLTDTAGAVPVKTFVQKLPAPDPKTFVGSGKIQEIETFVRDNDINLAIFDEELSPSQMRNIEKVLKCRILDRTNLILDIFARRARTAHARVQVELAQYEYLLPRLTRMWTHLERQKGGIGLRGPGEAEIETDRRIIRDKITRLKQQLQKLTNSVLSSGKTDRKWFRWPLWDILTLVSQP